MLDVEANIKMDIEDVKAIQDILMKNKQVISLTKGLR